MSGIFTCHFKRKLAVFSMELGLLCTDVKIFVSDQHFYVKASCSTCFILMLCPCVPILYISYALLLKFSVLGRLIDE